MCSYNNNKILLQYLLPGSNKIFFCAQLHTIFSFYLLFRNTTIGRKYIGMYAVCCIRVRIENILVLILGCIKDSSKKKSFLPKIQNRVFRASS